MDAGLNGVIADTRRHLPTPEAQYGCRQTGNSSRRDRIEITNAIPMFSGMQDSMIFIETALHFSKFSASNLQNGNKNGRSLH